MPVQFGHFIKFYEYPTLKEISEGMSELTKVVGELISKEGYKEEQFGFKPILSYISNDFFPSFSSLEDVGVKATLALRADLKGE